MVVFNKTSSDDQRKNNVSDRSLSDLCVVRYKLSCLLFLEEFVRISNQVDTGCSVLDTVDVLFGVLDGEASLNVFIVSDDATRAMVILFV